MMRGPAVRKFLQVVGSCPSASRSSVDWGRVVPRDPGKKLAKLAALCPRLLPPIPRWALPYQSMGLLSETIQLSETRTPCLEISITINPESTECKWTVCERFSETPYFQAAKDERCDPLQHVHICDGFGWDGVNFFCIS